MPKPDGVPLWLHLRVREIVQEHRMTQTAIAEQVGVHRNHLCRMLTGRRPLTWHWAVRILSVCGYELTCEIRPVGQPEQ